MKLASWLTYIYMSGVSYCFVESVVTGNKFTLFLLLSLCPTLVVDVWGVGVPIHSDQICGYLRMLV